MCRIHSFICSSYTRKQTGFNWTVKAINSKQASQRQEYKMTRKRCKTFSTWICRTITINLVSVECRDINIRGGVPKHQGKESRWLVLALNTRETFHRAMAFLYLWLIHWVWVLLHEQSKWAKCCLFGNLVCIVYVIDSLCCQLIGNSWSTMKNSSILYLDTEVSAMCLPALSVFLGIVLVGL